MQGDKINMINDKHNWRENAIKEAISEIHNGTLSDPGTQM